MNIKLTDEQKAHINKIFWHMAALSEDKEFMELLYNARDIDYDDDDEDAWTLDSLVDNIIDSAKSNFDYYNIKRKKEMRQ